MGGPALVVVEDGVELAMAGADVVTRTISDEPRALVVVATGETPIATYTELAIRRHAGWLDTSGVTVVQLDEYLDLEPDDRRSLLGWMRRSFLEPLGIGDERVLRLPTDGDLPDACAAFDADLDGRGPVDLAIVGLGPNGHLGFNEPPCDRAAPTREVALAPATIDANARYWGDRAVVPTRAVTLGMRHLLAARHVLLLVAGERKREIVHRALEGEVGPEVPASYLQEADHVTVIVDRAAWGT